MKFGLSTFLAMTALVTSSIASAKLAQPKMVPASFPGTVKLVVDPGVGSKMDLLFVVDNSASTEQLQRKLAANVDFIINGLNGYDIHAAVITSTNYDPIDPVPCCGKFVNGFVVGKDPDFSNKLKTNILSVGIQGNGVEEFFQPILSALSEPLLSTDHPGFLRADAGLAIVIVTDTDDQGQVVHPDQFITKLSTVKGGNMSLISMAGVIIPSTEKNCDRNSEQDPLMLEDVFKKLGSPIVSLCATDFGQQLATLSTAITSKITRQTGLLEIPLPLVPDVKSISVMYGPVSVTPGDTAKGWTYDALKNLILIGSSFPYEYLPPAKFVIEYKPIDWK